MASDEREFYVLEEYPSRNDNHAHSPDETPTPILAATVHEDAQKTHDAEVLQRIGKPDMLRRFFSSVLAIWSFATTLSVSWQNVIFLASLALANGGRAGLVWDNLVVGLFMTLFYHTIKEKIAIWPVAGGQYFWVFEMAPKEYAHFLSFITGWQCVWAWQAFLAAGVLLVGTFVASLVYLYTGFSAFWLAPLTSITMALVVFVVNRTLAGALARIEPLLLAIHIISAGAFFFVVPTLQHRIGRPLSSVSDIFTSFENHNGWASVGGAAALGCVNAASSFLAYDSVAHVSPHVQNADKMVPKALGLSNIVNYLLTVGAAIVVAVCTPDVPAYLNAALSLSTPNGAFLQVFLHATGSPTLAIVLALPIAITLLASCCNSQMAAVRMSWDFAGDRGLPWSTWLFQGKMIEDSPRARSVPPNALLSSMILPVTLPLISLGSTTAVGAIISLAVACLMTSYLITSASSFYFRWQGKSFPETKYQVPRRRGMFCDGICSVFFACVIVIAMFPAAPSVSATTMNYTVVLWFACLSGGVCYWYLRARKVFKGRRDADTSGT